MPNKEKIVDERTADIEEIEREMQKPGIETKVRAVQKMIIEGNGKAKEELLTLLKSDIDDSYKDRIRKLLDLLSRHPIQVLLLSISAMIVSHTFFASVFAFLLNLVIFAPKWMPGFKMNSGIEDGLSELSILLALGPAYAIRWAKNRYPTVIKPAIPWLLLIPTSIVMTGVLMAIYDCLFVVEFMALKGLRIDTSSTLTNLLSFLHVKSLAAVPFASFFKHILASLAMLGTISLGYYGRLKKNTEEILGAFQVIEKV